MKMVSGQCIHEVPPAGCLKQKCPLLTVAILVSYLQLSNERGQSYPRAQPPRIVEDSQICCHAQLCFRLLAGVANVRTTSLAAMRVKPPPKNDPRHKAYHSFCGCSRKPA